MPSFWKSYLHPTLYWLYKASRVLLVFPNFFSPLSSLFPIETSFYSLFFLLTLARGTGTTLLHFEMRKEIPSWRRLIWKNPRNYIQGYVFSFLSSLFSSAWLFVLSIESQWLIQYAHMVECFCWHSDLI